jgi:NhaA family Na+:H+ antiporter
MRKEFLYKRKYHLYLSKLYAEFFNSEKVGGLILIILTILSLILANSSVSSGYLQFWNIHLAGHHLTHWINDGLMTIFFLLIGLELEREIYQGELSDFRNALLPIMGAIGGMLVPASIYLILNWGSVTQNGAGIPMATDIAFAIGILSLLGKRVPASLKIFLTALAVIDDLGAILVIAIFYSKSLALGNLFIALGIFLLLITLNVLKVKTLIPYIVGGVVMWYFMLHSGIHATITGVLLAFAIPFNKNKEESPSYKMQHYLHKPVAFIVLPVFALANTCIYLGDFDPGNFISPNSLGIFLGLIIGKPLGILLFSFLGVFLGLCSLPGGIRWRNIAGAGILGGIGFTMSIFISMLAFDNPVYIINSKITILLSSLIAGIIGLLFLATTLKKNN